MTEDPVAICKAAGAAAKERYAGKDVAGMLALAEAGFARALADAAAHPDRASELRRAAKALAYNAAANCWPGWGDEGIEIDAESLARGVPGEQRSDPGLDGRRLSRAGAQMRRSARPRGLRRIRRLLRPPRPNRQQGSDLLPPAIADRRAHLHAVTNGRVRGRRLQKNKR
jgi:hypothetical protein